MIFKWFKHNLMNEFDNTVFEAGGPQKIAHVTMDLNVIIYSAGIGDLEAGLKSSLIKQLQLMQEILSRHERVDSCSALQFKPRGTDHLLTVIQTVGSLLWLLPLFSITSSPYNKLLRGQGIELSLGFVIRFGRFSSINTNVSSNLMGLQTLQLIWWLPCIQMWGDKLEL